MASPEDEFETIAQAADEKASGVDCSPEEYRRGLRLIIATLHDAIVASEETDPDA